MNVQRSLRIRSALIIGAGLLTIIVAGQSVFLVGIGSLLIGMGVSLWAMAEYLPGLAFEYLKERYNVVIAMNRNSEEQS